MNTNLKEHILGKKKDLHPHTHQYMWLSLKNHSQCCRMRNIITKTGKGQGGSILRFQGGEEGMNSGAICKAEATVFT